MLVIIVTASALFAERMYFRTPEDGQGRQDPDQHHDRHHLDEGESSEVATVVRRSVHAGVCIPGRLLKHPACHELRGETNGLKQGCSEQMGGTRLP